eukprot:1182338-Prorocentrum_minimum.AAC.3
MGGRNGGGVHRVGGPAVPIRGGLLGRVRPPLRAAKAGFPGRAVKAGFPGEVSVKCSEPREPQNPTKSEEYQRHLQGVLYIV